MKTEGDVKKGGNDTRTRNKLTFLQWSIKYILCFVSQYLIRSTIAEVTTCLSISVSRTIFLMFCSVGSNCTKYYHGSCSNPG